MLEIYYGNGKGKTTAAVGLAVRALGNHIPVIFAQFLKDGRSGEVEMLKKLGAQILLPDTFFGFVRTMTESEIEKTKTDYKGFLAKISELANQASENISQATSYPSDDRGNRIDCTEKTSENISDNTFTSSDETVALVIVLDEVLHACRHGLLSEDALIAFLTEMPKNTEVVCTGCEPSERIMEHADYCSHVQKEKHPFDKGISARRGIEM